MANGAQAGKVQTVLGLISPGELGITLTHEHILCDFSVVTHAPDTASGKAFYQMPVTLETLGRIVHYAEPNADDRRMMDIPTAIDEAMLYKQYGGQSVVDATCVGISRDPIGLARIARATGLNVIMGASYYLATTHPSDMDSRTEDQIYNEIVADVTEGVGDTRVKAGVIGEVGCSWPLADNERKALRASARAQRATGAPLLIHPGRDEKSPSEVIEVLRESGADLGRTIISHIDRTVFHRETLNKIAETGCYLEWDLFGREYSYFPANLSINMPSDAKRLDDIMWTISQGHGRKVVIAQDICNKHRLERYGGHGYSYILGNILPRMRTRGFSGSAIDDIMVNNPREVLTFTEAR